MDLPPENKKPLDVTELAGEAREGFRSGDLDRRLVRYGRAREDALQFSDFLVESGHSKLAHALSSCGNYLTFRHYFTIGEFRLSSICTCKKHIICQLCAIRRGAKALRVYLERYQLLLERNPSLKAYMVTLTVKNGNDLSERFNHLTKSLRSYHKRRKGTRQHGEVLKASSAVWSYEFTNKGNGWHPHVHCIWLCEEEPNQYLLANEWNYITQDSYIVDVRPINAVDPITGFLEVFKYALKFADLSFSDRLHAFYTLKGKRLQDSFGGFRGCVVEPKDSDNLLEELPYIELFYYYKRNHGYFQTNTTGEVINV